MNPGVLRACLASAASPVKDDFASLDGSLSGHGFRHASVEAIEPHLDVLHLAAAVTEKMMMSIHSSIVAGTALADEGDADFPDFDQSVQSLINRGQGNGGVASFHRLVNELHGRVVALMTLNGAKDF